MSDLFKRIWLTAAKFSLAHDDTDTAEALLNYWPTVASKDLERIRYDLEDMVKNHKAMKERLPL